MLDARLKEIYSARKSLFDKRLEEGRLDGVMLQMSCIADVADNGCDLDAVTHTIYYSRSALQAEEARNRFEGFKRIMAPNIRPMSWSIYPFA